MAIIKKTLFPENLEKYNTFINDTDSNSKYFKITELNDTFTGGKNAFLIQGSEFLVPDTLIKIEIKDSKGDTIYFEPGEGMVSASFNGESFVTEYYEGTSKVVAVYIYPDTAYGKCTITILGELSQYDNNGFITDVPSDWKGTYNVKWQKQINVNPKLANSTKIRFYKRPTAGISEILSPIYSIVGGNKVASAVTQSFANIKLSNLETFAGDVKRVKVFRTSQGDISDYDLIQDILVESKELLTTYGLSGSVVGNTGTFTSETLKNYWNSGSLTASLNSTRVEAGVLLSGSGKFTYTQSLNLKSTNTYELNLDAFYSSSIDSNLGIYLVSGSTSSSIGTLYGIQPTKNLLDTVIPFTIDKDYPTASLYLSQSKGEWHVGNISLKLSQDTAFSPDEISFVTTMPTVLGNETYNFKFEFYDVNNNYVPVAVTQSATFNGGNTNIGGTILLISSSASSSLSSLYAVSSSISGTVTYNSSSVSGTIGSVSSSVSGTIGSVSSSVSGTIGTLSGSVSASVALTLSSSLSKVKQLADGQYSGVFIDGNTVFAPVIGGTTGYISGKFQVGNTNPIILDATTSTRKIYIGTGTYNNSNTSVYLDSTGQFSLKDKLSWDGTTLNIVGNINAGSSVPNTVVTGLGSLSTKNTVATSDINANAITTGLLAANAVTEGILAANAVTEGKISANAVVADKIAANAIVADKIAANAIIAGKIAADAVTATTIAANSIVAGKIATSAVTADTIAAGAVTANKITVSDLYALNATIGGWNIDSNSIYKGTKGSDGAYTAGGGSITIGSGWISAANFFINSTGNAAFRGFINATGGAFSGTVTAGSGVSIGPGGITCSGDNNGIDIGGGRGIFSSTGGNIYIAGPGGTGVFFVTNSDTNNNLSWGSLSPGRLDINRGYGNDTALSISAYGGSGNVMRCYGNGGYYFEGTYHEFKPYSGNLIMYLRSLQLDPSNPGTNYAVKIISSSGQLFMSSSTRKHKNIYGNWKTDENILDNILKVPVQRFKYKSWKDTEVETFGLIAEDLHNNGLWQAVTYDSNDDGKAIYEEEKVAGIDYEKVTSVLWKAVQELTKKIEDLETKLNNK